MAVIQIKRRTTVGSGPLVGTTGNIYQAEPQIDFNQEKLFVAKSTKTASVGTPITLSDYVEFISAPEIQSLISDAIIGQGLGTAAAKNVGTGSGNVPILDANGKLVDSIIPKIAITNTHVVATEAAMLALSQAQEGDVAVRTDIKKTFILKTAPAATLANWQVLETPTDAVTSVNGSTGVVTISLAGLGGLATTTYNAHVSSNLHLTQTQRDIISAVYRIENEESTGHAMVDAIDFASETIGYSILVHEEIDTSGVVPVKTHSWGVNKNMVLTPQSIIDGGNF